MTAMRILLGGVFVAFILIFGCKKSSEGIGPGGGGGTITVNGFVKDLSGTPISGAAVVVTGKAPVTSGSNGAFSVAGVTTPYDIIAIMGLQNPVTIYKGITRSDPVLLIFGITAALKSATITGNVAGTAGKITTVFFVSGSRVWTAVADPATGNYSIFPTWYDTNSVWIGQIYALRWTSSGGLPLNYDGYGSKNDTISDGGTFSNVNFTSGDLTDPAEQNIAGNVVRPPGYTLSARYLYLYFGNARIQIALESGSIADGFSYSVPNIPAATFGVQAEAAQAETTSNRTAVFVKAGISGGASSVSVVLEAASQPTFPLNNALNIDTSSVFQWSQGGGTGINLAYIYDGGSHPRFYIFTAGPGIQIPNLAAQGLGLPSSIAYSWYVQRFFPLSSIDDAATDNFLSPSGDFGNSRSETLRFTTRP